MKAIVPLLVLAWATAADATDPPAKPPPPAMPGPAAKPAPPKDPLAAMVRFRGKPGKPATNVMTATRSDGLPDLKVAALAPATEGLTHSEKPRLWWVQSHDTRAGELEFVLTELRDSGPLEVFRAAIPPLKAGYNFIDLANPRANPGQHALEAGKGYQWAINLRAETAAKPVFCRVSRAPALDLDPAADAAARIDRLSAAGNWYELFDLAALKARSGGPDWVAARDSLVSSIGLADAVNP